MSAENQSEMAETAAFPSRQTSTIFYGWWVVFAAAVGIALHIGPVVVGTFGVFLKPLNREFGWSRGQISFAISAQRPSRTYTVTCLPRLSWGQSWPTSHGVRI